MFTSFLMPENVLLGLFTFVRIALVQLIWYINGHSRKPNMSRAFYVTFIRQIFVDIRQQNEL